MLCKQEKYVLLKLRQRDWRTSSFLSVCGSRVAPLRRQGYAVRPEASLCAIQRRQEDCGVCGGVARYFDLDSSLVRAIWLLCVLAGQGCCYLILWIVMPLDPEYPMLPRRAMNLLVTVTIGFHRIDHPRLRPQNRKMLWDCDLCL